MLAPATFIRFIMPPERKLYLKLHRPNASVEMQRLPPPPVHLSREPEPLKFRKLPRMFTETSPLRFKSITWPAWALTQEPCVRSSTTNCRAKHVDDVNDNAPNIMIKVLK